MLYILSYAVLVILVLLLLSYFILSIFSSISSNINPTSSMGLLPITFHNLSPVLLKW